MVTFLEIRYRSLPLFFNIIKLTLLPFISEMLFMTFFMSCLFITSIIMLPTGHSNWFRSHLRFLVRFHHLKLCCQTFSRGLFEFFFSIFKPVYM
jgi:hypothetical protein